MLFNKYVVILCCFYHIHIHAYINEMWILVIYKYVNRRGLFSAVFFCCHDYKIPIFSQMINRSDLFSAFFFHCHYYKISIFSQFNFNLQRFFCELCGTDFIQIFYFCVFYITFTITIVFVPWMLIGCVFKVEWLLAMLLYDGSLQNWFKKNWKDRMIVTWSQWQKKRLYKNPHIYFGCSFWTSLLNKNRLDGFCTVDGGKINSYINCSPFPMIGGWREDTQSHLSSKIYVFHLESKTQILTFLNIPLF